MNGTPDYARHLRALGQALEILRVEHFEIEADGKSYLVQVLTRAAARGEAGPTAESTVRYIWASPEGSADQEIDPNLLHAMAKSLDLHYSPDDVIRLEQEWRAKRNDPNGTADPSSLSELLRTAGRYLTDRSVYLLKLRREGQSLVVHYEGEAGERGEKTLSDRELWKWRARMMANRARSFNFH